MEAETPRALSADFRALFQYQGVSSAVILCTLLPSPANTKSADMDIVDGVNGKRAQSAGYDGMVNYCVEGEPMNGMILGCCAV